MKLQVSDATARTPIGSISHHANRLHLRVEVNKIYGV